MTATSVGQFELADLCRNDSEVLAQLRSKGITEILELADLVENDIRQLKLKDLVVRRRLIRYVQEHSQPLPAIKTLDHLCLDHTRSINTLRKAGITKIQDLQELEPEDLDELEIAKIPVLRRLHKYLALQKKPQHRSTASLVSIQSKIGTMGTFEFSSSSSDDSTTKKNTPSSPKSPSIMLRTKQGK